MPLVNVTVSLRVVFYSEELFEKFMGESRSKDKFTVTQESFLQICVWFFASLCLTLTFSRYLTFFECFQDFLLFTTRNFTLLNMTNCVFKVLGFWVCCVLYPA